MSQELIYTSAPRGLKPGSAGFCTVIQTQGMAAQLAARLEALSGYRQVFAPQDPQAALNPVVYSHLRIAMAGKAYHVLSRIAAAGLDYSQRTNKFAHHVAIEPTELVAAGPGSLLALPGFMQSTWDGQPKVLPSGRRIPNCNAQLGICRAWQQQTGDAGWGGVLAESVLNNPPANVTLIYPLGLEPLPLIVESLALLSPQQRWGVTFSTYFTKLPTGVDCNWRCVLQGSPEAAAPAGKVIDLCRALGQPAGGSLVDAARTGISPVAAPAPRAPAKTIQSQRPDDDELAKLLADPANPRLAGNPATASQATPTPVDYGLSPPIPPRSMTSIDPYAPALALRTFRRKEKSKLPMSLGIGAALLALAGGVISLTIATKGGKDVAQTTTLNGSDSGSQSRSETPRKIQTSQSPTRDPATKQPAAEAQGSKTPEIKTPDSKTPDSKTQDSKTQDSKTQGSKTQGSKTQGSKTQGSKTQGSKTQDSKTQDSKTQDSKTQDSKTPGSKTPDSKTPDSKTPDSKTPDSKTPDSKTPDSKTPDSKTPDSKTPDSKTPDSKTPDSKTPDSKTPDSKTPDSKTPDSKTPDSKTPDSKTPDSKRPEPKPPAGKILAALPLRPRPLQEQPSFSLGATKQDLGIPSPEGSDCKLLSVTLHDGRRFALKRMANSWQVALGIPDSPLSIPKVVGTLVSSKGGLFYEWNKQDQLTARIDADQLRNCVLTISKSNVQSASGPIFFSLRSPVDAPSINWDQVAATPNETKEFPLATLSIEGLPAQTDFRVAFLDPFGILQREERTDPLSNFAIVSNGLHLLFNVTVIKEDGAEKQPPAVAVKYIGACINWNLNSPPEDLLPHEVKPFPAPSPLGPHRLDAITTEKLAEFGGQLTNLKKSKDETDQSFSERRAKLETAVKTWKERHGSTTELLSTFDTLKTAKWNYYVYFVVAKAHRVAIAALHAKELENLQVDGQ